MVKGKDVAKWFIYHNPELASGYIDENTKVNKLLYFSNLMYFCMRQENLIEEDFIAFPNGPVVYSVYRDYRYNGLNRLPGSEELINLDKEKEIILNIVNFVYGNMTTSELVEESHSHSLWSSVKSLIPNNPKLDFRMIEEELVEYNCALYRTYAEMDFSNLRKEKINNNVYYYFENTFDLTEEIIEQLSSLPQRSEPLFLEMIEGEVVVS